MEGVITKIENGNCLFNCKQVLPQKLSNFFVGPLFEKLQICFLKDMKPNCKQTTTELPFNCLCIKINLGAKPFK